MLARTHDFGEMVLRPSRKCPEDADQRATKRGERIFDPGWYDRIDRAGDDAAAFKFAQSLGEYLLRYVSECTCEFVVAHGLLVERVNDKHRPFIGNKVEYAARRTGRAGDIPFFLYLSFDRFHLVSIAQNGIYLQVGMCTRYTQSLLTSLTYFNSMNEKIISALNWRYAVQVFDPSKKVSEQDLTTILESGRLAPNSFGLEPATFVVVTNPDVRAKLRAVGYGQPKITDASHLIVVTRTTNPREHIVDDRILRTAKIQKQDVAALDGFRKMLDGTLASRDDAALDSWLKAQTYISLGMMMETASLLGVDNAAMEGFDVKGVDEVLGLSAKHLTATTMLAIGYRGEDEAATRPKVRREFDDVVQFVK